jgi:hypothetical protein
VTLSAQVFAAAETVAVSELGARQGAARGFARRFGCTSGPKPTGFCAHRRIRRVFTTD